MGKKAVLPRGLTLKKIIDKIDAIEESMTSSFTGSISSDDEEEKA